MSKTYNNDIQNLTPREHLLLRPTMYIGSIDENETQEYLEKDDKVQLCTVSYIPALFKIINEIIDNSVDIAIKTNFKGCNKVSVKITNEYVEVQDNGPGIPVKKILNKNTNVSEYMPKTAWGSMMSGSNFDTDANHVQAGMNGIGSYGTNVWSKKFIGISDDGENRYTVTFKDNAESCVQSLDKSKEHGVYVKFYPDLARFKIDKISEVYLDLVKQRLTNLSLTYPLITFKFNGKTLKTNTFKKYVQKFSDNFEILEGENFSYAFLPNDNDEFRFYSYVNGLSIKDGGTHLDVVVNNIVSRIREKLEKKFKGIKPADIKNKFMVVSFLRNFPNPKFNSQTKEKITNSSAEVNSYLGEVDYDTISKKILKNDVMINLITEIYKIKEEFKRRQEMKGLEKPKKIKDEKYTPPIGNNDVLIITEGYSAFSGISKILGRDGIGYYELRGKPLNAYSSSQQKFTANKELSTLYQIIKNCDYKKIVIASDADLDGFHIRALLCAFFIKYLNEYLNKIGMLQTPVVVISKGGKPVKWSYSLNEHFNLSSGETLDYKKGLGSWEPEDLQYIISKDGLDKMIDMIDFNGEIGAKAIDEWFGDSAEKRKEHILNNNFSIAKV